MNSSFWINVGMAVLLQLLSDGQIPQKYVKGLKKLRDALNAAFPPDQDEPAAHIQIT